jgi:hypothetical protein
MYIWVEYGIPSGCDKECNPIHRSVQRNASDKQDNHHKVREQRRKVRYNYNSTQINP